MRQGKSFWQAQAYGERRVNEHLTAELAAAKERIGELEDGLRARTLAELRAVRPVAMPAYPDGAEDSEEWGYDGTGLIREKLPPLTPAEQAIADQLRS